MNGVILFFVSRGFAIIFTVTASPKTILLAATLLVLSYDATA